MGRSILPMPTTVGWGQQVFLTGNNREYFLCKPVIGFAGRASVAVQKSASFLQQYEMRTSEPKPH